MKYSTLILFILLMNSCKSYIDVMKNNINDNDIVFNYGIYKNDFKYFNKINPSSDGDIYYTTHFDITLPKKILNWTKVDNSFFFEYDDKQIFYIYSSYKNEGNESENWYLKDIDHNDVLKYIGKYWDKKKYNENYLYEIHNKRTSKLYTNGKYKIILFNIKNENLNIFIQSAKTFNVW